MTLWDLVSGAGSVAAVELIVLPSVPPSEPTYQQCLQARVTGLGAVILSWGNPQLFPDISSATRQLQVSLVALVSLLAATTMRYLALVDTIAPGSLLQVLDLGGEITVVPGGTPLICTLTLIAGPGEGS